MKRAALAIITILSLTSHIAVAKASEPSAVTGGIALGLSSLSDGDIGLASELNIGLMLSSRTAIYVEASGTLIPSGAYGDAANQELQLDNSTLLTAGAKHWILGRLWSKASVGVSQISGNEGEQSVDATGFGAAAAIGYSITPGGTFNVIGRGAIGVFSDVSVTDFGLLLGVQF